MGTCALGTLHPILALRALAGLLTASSSLSQTQTHRNIAGLQKLISWGFLCMCGPFATRCGSFTIYHELAGALTLVLAKIEQCSLSRRTVSWLWTFWHQWRVRSLR